MPTFLEDQYARIRGEAPDFQQNCMGTRKPPLMFSEREVVFCCDAAAIEEGRCTDILETFASLNE